VLSVGGKKIYLSGDTQGIPEMRALTGIDVAFVCMNLPYTMDINEAADAVLAFKPKIVYPYHYRGQNGMSDVNAFKNLVQAGNKNIEVRLRNWYPG
jgi:L-ascorbate metabolism protein UlaG (beta-lactamase superfamily)